jgi:class 3 adenylate cyclase/tetratricopeptide (TPR) repeat protein
LHRKVVTVVFCDVVGSTALGESVDPEALRGLLADYFERMRAILERHGGSVEKFIGDAVMAVFGVPVVHEDDALRAVRAAVEMREALPALGVEGRIGVMTGEVVTGTEERLATGDAVNVAARLQQQAKPGEILIGAETMRLTRDAVVAEAVEPLDLKGKTEPVPAYLLIRAGDLPERPHAGPFVGRGRELAVLGQAWERTLAAPACELVTIVGDAGVGKSRLVAEALATVGAAVVRGRCLPYGEGITYWPVVEVLKQLRVMSPDDRAAAAIRSLLGETETATSAEEVAWAFRKTLEHASAERPLVVVFDDIQWGEETFLDLIEHVALLSSGSAILLLCTARPELSESRPAWPVALRLEPLGDDDVQELIPEGIRGGLRERITRAAGGNPLFVEEMLAMAEETDGDVAVPPTLQALLSARLDQLDATERSVLERGAVEGEVFHRGALQALAPEEAQVTPQLAALVRKQLIRPERPLLVDDDGFRFRHLLIRDAAYDALPKATRAELHQRFAAWLEQRGDELVELDELLGYHLEQACRYRRELGLEDDAALADAARRRLTAGGLRAARYQDYPAAVRLLERAGALMPPDDFDLALEVELGNALVWLGRTGDAVQRADAAAERAGARGDQIGELCGRIRACELRLYGGEGTPEELTALVDEALPAIQSADDDAALFIAHLAYTGSAFELGKYQSALRAYELALSHARKVGYQPTDVLANRTAARFFGTTSASDTLAWLDENEPHAGRNYFFRAHRAGTLAMLGRFDEARAILAEDRAALAERGGGVLLANITAFESAWVELWAGDPAAAAGFAAEGWRLHTEQGESFALPFAAATVSRTLYELGRFDEAEAWADRAAELPGSVLAKSAQLVERQVRAKLLARRGEHAEAERLVRAAVTVSDGTEMLDAQGDAHADLAEVLLLGGKVDEAAASLRNALERYERKENLAMADRTRARLARLDDRPPP